MVNFKLLTILTITTTSLMKIKAYKLASSIIMTTFWEICSIKIKVNKITSSIKISIYKMANLVYPKLCRLASWMKNKIFKDLNLMTIKVSRIVSSDILFYILTFIYDDQIKKVSDLSCDTSKILLQSQIYLLPLFCN